MRIYKPTWKRPGGTEYECPRYYVQFHLGGKLFRKALGTTDKRVAEEKAMALRRREERRAAGLLDPAEESQQKALKDHVADFMTTLKSHGCSKSHLYDRSKSLDEFMEATGSTTLRDLDSGRAAKWLNDMKDRGLAARTINKRLQAIRQLARFLVQGRRLGFDPFLALKPLNEASDRRHVRRALLPDELQRLLTAAEARPVADATTERVNKGVTTDERVRLLALGKVRALAYAVAAGTGLRRGELSRLRWGDVDLDRRVVSVTAASAKSRRDQSVPLRSDLAEALARHRPEEPEPGDLVFPPPGFPNLRTFKRDLVAAGLATLGKDEKGRERFDTDDGSERALDFHCLRVTFVSSLVAANVHPRVAQALARHAKIETTMAVYTDLTSLDLRGAVESTIARPRRSRVRA